MPLPEPSENESQDEFIERCIPTVVESDDVDQEQAAAICYEQWRGEKAAGNALKAVSRTDEELRVANYIVLYGGRDLEGIATPRRNADGSTGEYFTSRTQIESRFTKAGRLPVDWEHRMAPEGEDPGYLGYVDWTTAKKSPDGIWVERVLDRRNQYVQLLEDLIDAGMIGNSSEADPMSVKKAENGELLSWPIVGDTLTVSPMEPRMLTGNVLQAAKALGLIESPEPEAEPEADAEGREVALAAEAAKAMEQAMAHAKRIEIRLALED